MKFENPPHGGKFKLVATKKHKNDIGLIVLCPDRREYSWNNVSRLHNGVPPAKRGKRTLRVVLH